MLTNHRRGVRLIERMVTVLRALHDKAMWSKQVLLKYWSLQAAGWVVVFAVLWFAGEVLEWPRRFVWIGLTLWAAKDVVLYPLVWRAYDDSDVPRTGHPQPGAEGVVVRRLDPAGAVRVRGERWRARIAEGSDMGGLSLGQAPIEEGEHVDVLGREGMTLIVARRAPASGAARNT